MSQVASLIDELERSLVYGTTDQRMQALWRGTHPFVVGASRYNTEQIGLFDDVIGKLATAIEGKARAKLATRLSTIANAPENLMRTFAFDDDIDVARPVLTTSERLNDAELIATANTKSQQHL